MAFAFPTVAAAKPPTLVFAGDLLPTARAEKLVKTSGLSAPFQGVADILQRADVAVGNLECPLSTRGKPVEKTYTFRGKPAGAHMLRAAGFDVVTLANNHTGDFGPAALVDTVAACRRYGLQPVGAGRNAAEARRPVLLRRGQPPVTIAILAFSNMEPTEFFARAGRAGTNPAWVARITRDVQSARAKADVVVVLFHWGVELSKEPSDSQRALAYAAADAGADLVVGSHPHVLQGIQRRGRTVIAYSLGNFLFPSARAATRQTALLSYLADPGGARVQLVPCVIDGFRPRLATPKERTAILAHVADLSEALGTAIGQDGTVGPQE